MFCLINAEIETELKCGVDASACEQFKLFLKCFVCDLP